MNGSQPLILAPLRSQIRPGGSQAKKSKAFLLCNMCTAPLTIRDSEHETPTFKKLTLQCSNPGCNASSVWDVSLRYMLNPGLHHRPDMDVPLCPHDRIPQIYPPASKVDARQASMFEPPPDNSG